MKAHNYILIVLSVCLLCSCIGQSNPYALDVPDKVTVVKTDKHIRIKGTCIFIIPPEGFVQAPQQSALVNREGIFMTFVEGINRDVNKIIDLFLKKVPEVYTYGETGFWKEFRIDKDEAFAANTQWDEERTQLSITLGNRSYFITMGCKYPSSDLLFRDAIFRSMLTAYIDTTYRAESIKDFACFTVDLSGTDLKPAYYGANTYYYTINGVDPAPDSGIDLVFTVRPMLYEEPEKYTRLCIQKDTIYKAEPIHIIEINDYPAVEYYSEGVVSGKKIKGYSVVFGNGKTSLHIRGMIYNMKYSDEYLAEFKRIVQTIRFKERDESP